MNIEWKRRKDKFNLSVTLTDNTILLKLFLKPKSIDKKEKKKINLAK
jgi:hypothetical protein